MRTDLFIDDTWQPEAGSGRRFATIDPATEQTVAEVARGDAADIDRAVRAADAARRGPWREMTPTERGRLLHQLADAICARRDEIARLETLDVGKPLKDSQGDVDGVDRAR